MQAQQEAPPRPDIEAIIRDCQKALASEETGPGKAGRARVQRELNVALWAKHLENDHAAT